MRDSTPAYLPNPPTTAGNHPRYHSALSDVSTVVNATPPVLMHSLSARAAPGAAVAAGSSGAPTVTALPRSYTVPTRPSVEAVPASASGELLRWSRTA